MTDLNRLSAEVIMGWEARYEGYHSGRKAWFWRHPKTTKGIEQKDWTPLTDMNQCFQVVERMRELGWFFSCHNELPQWIARFFTKQTFPGKGYLAVDLNRAILTAALKAKGMEVE